MATALISVLTVACGPSATDADTTTTAAAATTSEASTTTAPDTTTTTENVGCALVDGQIVIEEAQWGTIDPASEQFAPLGLSPEETETVVCTSYAFLTSGEDPFDVMRSLVDELGYPDVVSDINSNGNLFFHPVPGPECEEVFAAMGLGYAIDFALFGPELDQKYFRLVGGACDGEPEAGSGVGILSMDFGGNHLETEIFECPIDTIEAGEFWHIANGRSIATDTDGAEWQVSAGFNISSPDEFSFEAIGPTGSPYFVATSQETTMTSEFEEAGAVFTTTFHDQVFQGEPDTEVMVSIECA